MMLAAIKIAIFGRDSAVSDLAKWRREVIRKSGYRSFVSGRTHNLEAHHKFHVSSYPLLATSVWNGCMMTRREHREHPRSYHSWERKIRNPLLRLLISETPIGLYAWKYFYWHWWKGGILSITALLLWQWRQNPELWRELSALAGKWL